MLQQIYILWTSSNSDPPPPLGHQACVQKRVAVRKVEHGAEHRFVASPQHPADRETSLWRLWSNIYIYIYMSTWSSLFTEKLHSVRLKD